MAQEQTQEAEIIPTQEVVATQVPASDDAVAGGESGNLDKWLNFATENNLVLLLGIAVIMGVVNLKNPQSQADYERHKATIEQEREAAEETPEYSDDVVAMVKYIFNEMRARDGAVVNANPKPPASSTGDDDEEAGTSVVKIEPFHPVPDDIDGGKIPEVWIPVNRNHLLKELGASGRAYREEDYDGRKVAIPQHFDFVAQPGLIKNAETGEEYLSPYPDTFYKFGQGFEMALESKAGRFGYAAQIKNFVLAGGARFTVVVQYHAEITPVGAAYLAGSLRINDEVVGDLRQMDIVDGDGEAQWLFGTKKDIPAADVLRVVAQVYLPYAVAEQGSVFLWKQFKIVPVPDDYGAGDSIIWI